MSAPPALSPALSKDAVAEILRRFGIARADDAQVTRTWRVHVAASEQLARLPSDFDKGLEPTHIFAVPRR